MLRCPGYPMQSFGDILGEVFRAMMANKLRTFLTMFGIAWGVGSLLVLVGLGEGFRSGAAAQPGQRGQRRDHDVERDHSRAAQSAHGHAALQADAAGRSRHAQAAGVALGDGDPEPAGPLRGKRVVEYLLAGDGRRAEFRQVRFVPLGAWTISGRADLTESPPGRRAGAQERPVALSRPSDSGRKHHHQRHQLHRGWDDGHAGAGQQ
jgi:hypothetical protein